MRELQAAESGAVGCDGSFYRIWIIRTLAAMLVVISLFLGACGEQSQPEGGQSGQEDSADHQGSQGGEGDRKDSTIARSGRDVFASLSDLPPPKPFSEGVERRGGAIRWSYAGLKDVVVQSDGALYAHPPSGATFTIKNERRPVSVTFTPSFLSKAPDEKTDGVTFKVWSGKQRVYREHVRPDDPASAVTLNLSEARTSDESKLSFVTRAGPVGDLKYDWAIWRDVRIVVGGGEGGG